MFISILLANTIVMMEKKSQAHFRNYVTPTSNTTYVLATYITCVIIVLIQLIVIIGISAYFFKIPIYSPDSSIENNLINGGKLIAVLMTMSTFFIFIGMAVGYLFNSEETSILASISIGSVFLFLSNTILPLESMSQYILGIAKYNPFVLSSDLLREMLFFKPAIETLANGFYLLGIYILSLFVLIVITHSIARKRFFYKFAMRRAIRKRRQKQERMLPNLNSKKTKEGKEEEGDKNKEEKNGRQPLQILSDDEEDSKKAEEDEEDGKDFFEMANKEAEKEEEKRKKR